jgi:hypothetical protein
VGDCRSRAALAKPAISSFCAFSNAWPSSRFASAETPRADRQLLGRAGATLTDSGMAGTSTAKEHSNLISAVQKDIILILIVLIQRYRSALSSPRKRAPQGRASGQNPTLGACADGGNRNIAGVDRRRPIDANSFEQATFRVSANTGSI